MSIVSNVEQQSLSEDEKEKIAWNMTYRTILNQIACVAGLVFIGYLFYLIGSYINIVDIISNNAKFIGITFFWVVISALFSIGMFVHAQNIYEEKYKSLFGGPETKGWLLNKGVCPSVKRVSVEFKDGKKKWNIDPNTENWDLDIKNPIKEYLIKK